MYRRLLVVNQVKSSARSQGAYIALDHVEALPEQQESFLVGIVSQLFHNSICRTLEVRIASWSLRCIFNDPLSEPIGEEIAVHVAVAIFSSPFHKIPIHLTLIRCSTILEFSIYCLSLCS